MGPITALMFSTGCTCGPRMAVDPAGSPGTSPNQGMEGLDLPRGYPSRPNQILQTAPRK